jgi:hypothetical protein
MFKHCNVEDFRVDEFERLATVLVFVINKYSKPLHIMKRVRSMPGQCL